MPCSTRSRSVGGLLVPGRSDRQTDRQGPPLLVPLVSQRCRALLTDVDGVCLPACLGSINVQDTRGYAAIRKQLSGLSKGSAVSAPAPRVVQERAERQVVYGEKSKTVADWLPLVAAARQADTLNFSFQPRQVGGEEHEEDIKAGLWGAWADKGPAGWLTCWWWCWLFVSPGVVPGGAGGQVRGGHGDGAGHPGPAHTRQGRQGGQGKPRQAASQAGHSLTHMELTTPSGG